MPTSPESPPSGRTLEIVAGCAGLILFGLAAQYLLAPRADGEGWGLFESFGFISAGAFAAWHTIANVWRSRRV